MNAGHFLLEDCGGKMEPSEGSMKLLRLTVIAALFACAIVLSACAQTTQLVTDQGSTAAQAAPAPGATEPYAIFPAKPPRFQLPTRRPSRDFEIRGQLPGPMQPTPPQGEFDRGIYVRKPAASGDTSCASILSYNFSGGENPQLENVTTCTSASMTNALRARGKDKKPVGPLFKTTDLKTVSPQ
jgi:hypothetical protein